MRVALIHTQLRHGGGMESYLVELVRGFQARGDAVSVWARNVDPALAARLSVEAHAVSGLPLPRVVRNAALSQRIHRLHLQDRHDLVISLARTRGQDIAITGGTHPGFLGAMARRAGFDDRVETRLERECFASSAQVVAHSRSLAAELARFYGIADGRVHVLYPPIDTARFRVAGPGARLAARAALGLGEQDIAFLFPSMGHARKGLDVLLQAFRALAEPRAVLLVAGRRRSSRADLADAGLRVRDLDYVSDMPALYAAVDCTVLPSRYEPFGLVIAESLQCGTGVITAASSGVAELLAGEEGLCVEAEDAAALARALRQVCEAPLHAVPGFAQRHGLERDTHVQSLVELGRRARARVVAA